MDNQEGHIQVLVKATFKKRPVYSTRVAPLARVF